MSISKVSIFITIIISILSYSCCNDEKENVNLFAIGYNNEHVVLFVNEKLSYCGNDDKYNNKIVKLSINSHDSDTKSKKSNKKTSNQELENYTILDQNLDINLKNIYFNSVTFKDVNYIIILQKNNNITEVTIKDNNDTVMETYKLSL